MKKTILLFLIAINSTLFAQDKTLEINADGSIQEVQKIEGKGLIINTRSEPSRMVPSAKLKTNILLVDENLNIVWNKSYSIPIKNVSYDISISSSNSEGVYWFYNAGGMYSSKTNFIAKKITWAGTEEDIEIKGVNEKVKMFNYNSDVNFVDQDILYCINNNMEKGITTTYMYTINFKTKEVTDISLSLPARPAYKDSRGWSYMGHGDGKIYFKSMDIPKGSKIEKIATYIAVIDYTGKMISTCQFDLDFAPKIAYMVYNFQEYNDEHLADNNNAADDQIYNFSSMKLSSDKKHVYLYSLFKDEGGLGKSRTGYLIAKYSIDGKKVWQNNYPFTGAILNDKKIVTHASPTSLNVYFDICEEQKTVNFHFWDIKEKNTYHAIASDTDGKLVDFFSTNNSTWAYQTVIDSEGHAVYRHQSVPPQVVPVVSKKYNQALMNFIAQKGALSFVKKVGKNHFVFERSPSKGGSLKAYSFEEK